MIYDYRRGGPRGPRGRGRFRCLDAATGDVVAGVFYYDTETHKVGRYQTDATGGVVLNSERRVLDVWETRELLLVPLDDAADESVIVHLEGEPETGEWGYPDAPRG